MWTPRAGKASKSARVEKEQKKGGKGAAGGRGSKYCVCTTASTQQKSFRNARHFSFHPCLLAEAPARGRIHDIFLCLHSYKTLERIPRQSVCHGESFLKGLSLDLSVFLPFGLSSDTQLFSFDQSIDRAAPPCLAVLSFIQSSDLSSFFRVRSRSGPSPLLLPMLTRLAPSPPSPWPPPSR